MGYVTVSEVRDIELLDCCLDNISFDLTFLLMGLHSDHYLIK